MAFAIAMNGTSDEWIIMVCATYVPTQMCAGTDANVRTVLEHKIWDSLSDPDYYVCAITDIINTVNTKCN